MKRSNLQTTTTNNKITLNKLLISTLLGNQKVLVDLSNPNTQIYLEIVCCKTDVFITVLIALVKYKQIRLKLLSTAELDVLRHGF